MFFRGVLLAMLGASMLGVAETVEETVDVAPVWAGHPVAFALLTHGDRQFAAFYDAERHMTVVARKLGESQWHAVVLPQDVVWDSHNSIVMCVDDGGYLHLSGNMHVVPLVYFRTTKPLDIDTFERVPHMTGDREDRCTYPQFLRGMQNELLFTYRDGRSGSGDQIYNVYDLDTQTWRRLIDQPLTSGKGEMNAYFSGATKGPDGYVHLCWVWRDNGGCETNHDLSYARSKDFVHWETSAGVPLALPITIDACEIVDPVPAHGGIINGNARLGFDSKGRPVIGYHKYDAKGNTQIYNARLEDGAWKIYQVTDWEYRWDFSGGGSIPFEVHVGGVSPHGDGQLEQSWSNKHYGSGVWLLDEATMTRIGEVEKGPAYPPEISGVASTFEGMQVRWAGDSGSSSEPGVRYVLRWETLPSHRDRPREGTLPEPSMLRVYKLRR